jgi:transposase
MMGRLKSDQGQLFYEFHLNKAVPEDHLVRKIDTALDLSWLRSELAPHYSSMGRPSIDPELMIRMLVVGYVFAIRSERLICREVQVNLAYRWFCKLGVEDVVRIIRRSRALAMSASAMEMLSAACSNGLSRHALPLVWLVAKDLPSMRA